SGGAEQAYEAAMLDGERDVVDDCLIAVALGEPPQFDRRHALASSPLDRLIRRFRLATIETPNPGPASATACRLFSSAPIPRCRHKTRHISPPRKRGAIFQGLVAMGSRFRGNDSIPLFPREGRLALLHERP